MLAAGGARALAFALVLLLAAGCGEDGDRPVAHYAAYPALDESPPPPPPRRRAEDAGTRDAAAGAADEASGGDDVGTPAEPPAVVQAVDRVNTAELIMQLRDHAATAEPDDPFALTEERLKALEKKGDIGIF